MRGEQSNSSIVFGSSLVLKLCIVRQIEPRPNDVQWFRPSQFVQGFLILKAI
jgi:hypothetical protein